MNRRAATYVCQILNRTFTDPLLLPGSGMIRSYLEEKEIHMVSLDELVIAIVVLLAWGFMTAAVVLE